MPREYWDHWLATSVHQKTAIHMPFVKEMLQRGISSMLDAGSGRGQRIKELAQLGFRITCVDASLTAVTHLRHLSEDPSIKHLNIVRADVLSLPFSNDSFGAALCFGVLNFFTEVSDRKRAFTEIFRVVKPGGIMLFTLMSTEDEGMKRGQLLGNSNVQLPDGVCLHYFTPSEMRNHLRTVSVGLMEQFTVEDTSHDAHHTHAFIRALAFQE